MAARVLLALIAVVVLAWVGVLLRNFEVGHEAALRGFLRPEAGQVERRRDLQRLEDAQLLDFSSYWELAAASYLLSGSPGRAARAAEALVRDEPRNIVAWTVLFQATQRRNPARSAQAAAEIRRLNPLGSR